MGLAVLEFLEIRTPQVQDHGSGIVGVLEF